MRRTLWCLLMLLVASAAVAGCGAASAPAPEGLALEFEHARREAVPLANVRLPGETTFTIAAVPCGLYTKRCYRLGEEVRQPTRYSHARTVGPRIIGLTGQLTDPGPAERGLLYLEAHQGCIGSYRYMVAYGVLQNARDRVYIEGVEPAVRMATAVIPGFIHARGVIVYAVVPAHGGEVVVRGPGGAVVNREFGSIASRASGCSR